MPDLGSIVEDVRSKNAGPFWLTVDIFCGSDEAFDRVSRSLRDAQIAEAVGIAPDRIKRFDIADLRVVKFSFPRPSVQGSAADRDMHGAALGALVAEIEIT